MPGKREKAPSISQRKITRISFDAAGCSITFLVLAAVHYMYLVIFHSLGAQKVEHIVRIEGRLVLNYRYPTLITYT